MFPSSRPLELKSMTAQEVVVVGVDSDSESALTLEYAVKEALMRKAALRVVSAFESSGMFGTRYGIPIPVTDDEIAARIRVETEALIIKAFAMLEEPPPVKIVIRPGATGWVLTQESKTADLLVIGHGDISSVLFGSIGLHCVAHAHCPVTVVRPAAVRVPENAQT
jgi:nucleotide-binding universal stress UspA family protein